MTHIVRRLIGIVALVGALGSGAASATPFPADGIFVSGGFDTFGSGTSIVSGLTFVDVNSGAAAMRPSCSGTSPGFGLCALPFGAFASDFQIGAPGIPMTYSFGGSTFVVPAAGYGAPVRTSLSCAGGSCVDSLTFEATGVVSGPGYGPIAFAMLWTANGSCSEGAIAGQCGDKYKASWSATIKAVNPIPEPGSLALIGSALVGFALARRRHRSSISGTCCATIL